MVIHDKVYDSTSFVDEHPYVFILLYLHPPFKNSRLETFHKLVSYTKSIHMLQGYEALPPNLIAGPKFK